MQRVKELRSRRQHIHSPQDRDAIKYCAGIVELGPNAAHSREEAQRVDHIEHLPEHST